MNGRWKVLITSEGICITDMGAPKCKESGSTCTDDGQCCDGHCGLGKDNWSPRECMKISCIPRGGPCLKLYRGQQCCSGFICDDTGVNKGQPRCYPPRQPKND